MTLNSCTFSFSRWKYGSKINDLNTRRSWRTGPVDQRENTLPLHHQPPPLRVLCGISAWLPKVRRCTQEDMWTILDTGIPDTSRNPCQELRWCDRRGDVTLPGQIAELFRQADWSYMRQGHCLKSEPLWRQKYKQQLCNKTKVDRYRGNC